MIVDKKRLTFKSFFCKIASFPENEGAVNGAEPRFNNSVKDYRGQQGMFVFFFYKCSG